MTEPTELIPCPFCGGAARHLPGKYGYWIERVICDACRFHISETGSHAAVELWNKRAPQTTTSGVQWQRGPQASGFTPETDNQPEPVSSDTLYLLRRLLSNQHTLTSAEFREELTKIVGEAAMRQTAS